MEVKIAHCVQDKAPNKNLQKQNQALNYGPDISLNRKGLKNNTMENAVSIDSPLDTAFAWHKSCKI